MKHLRIWAFLSLSYNFAESCTGLVCINFQRSGWGWIRQAACDWLCRGRRAYPKLNIWKCFLLLLLSRSVTQHSREEYHCQREDVVHKSRSSVWFLLPQPPIWSILHTWQCKYTFHLLPDTPELLIDTSSVVTSDNLFFKIKPSLIWSWHVYRVVSVHNHNHSLLMSTDVCVAGMSAVMISGLFTSPGNPDMLKSLRISENLISNQTALIECNFKGRIQTCITANAKNTPKMTSCGQQ